MASPKTWLASEHGTLPLAPVERSKGVFLRILYFVTRHRYGKVPTAFRVVYARFPGAGLASVFIVFVLERFLSIEQELRYLIQIATAMRNGCTFCSDLILAEAIRHKIGTDRFASLLDCEASDRFSEREKAALAYAAAVARDLGVPDSIFSRLKSNFSEREITEIVWICAVERYFNTMAMPLRIGSDRLAS